MSDHVAGPMACDAAAVALASGMQKRQGMKPFTFLSLAVAVPLALTLVAVREARACSIANCQPPVRLFQPERHIPSNLIRFKVTAADPGPLELRAVDGTVVPASIRMLGPDRVFGPDTPPAPDQRLTLRYRPVCFHSPPAGATPNPTEATFSFMTAAPVEMELQATELAMTEKGIVYAGPARHMIVRYRHTLPDRSAGAWHITDTTWTISGRPYATFWYPEAVISYCSPPMNDWRPDSCGTYGAVPSGKHLLQAHTRIVGVDQEFVAQLEVDTNCNQVLTIGNSSEPPDAGAADVPGDTRQTDAQAAGQAADAGGANAGERAAACSTAGGRGSSLGLGGLVLVGFATVTWRQRRRQWTARDQRHGG